MIKKAILFFLPLMVIFNNSFSQVLEPVKWSFSTEKISEEEYYLVYTANIEKGWTAYSQFTDADGPVPTEITYESMDGIELLGKGDESGDRKEGMDDLFGVNVIKFTYKAPFIIKQKIKILDISKPISGYITSMACDATKCLPPTSVDFSFEFESEAIDELSTADPANQGDVLAKPVKWTFTQEKISDSEWNFVFKADITGEWNVYSQYTPDDGPIPTSINYESADGIEIPDSGEETGHRKEIMDPIFGVDVIKFSSDEPFTITQKVKVNDPTKPITGYLEYMTCDNSKCLKETIDFTFNLDGTAAKPANINTSGLAEIDQKIPSLNETFRNPISNCGDEEEQKSGWLWLLLLGMGSGFFALLTPCVFPMIPITVSFFTKDTKRKGWVNGLIYGLSIIVIYVTIGLLITLIFGPEALNRLSTNWIANTLFFIIFMVFAFSFFGYYEITLPSSWSTKSDQMADKGGLLGIFFMAFTLALVSFSCTGPLIGTALVQAATTGDYIGPTLVMFGFALALALPFGLFAAFPAWLNTLPKSGSWMNSVKVILGFVEVALAFKFLSVADLTKHWGLLKYEVFMVIWILVAIGMALYLFGFIKFPHDSPIKKISPLRGIFGGLSVALAIYLMTGFKYNNDIKSYNALSLMSGLAPPTNYNIFLPKLTGELDPALAEKYDSYTICANAIPCFKDYYQGLEYAKSVGKPMLLDHTGYGCVNCRKTEEHIWIDAHIRKILTDSLVLVSLYVDDSQKLPEQLYSVSSGKKLRDVGDKWADFQISNFLQNTQPLYVPVTTDEKVISSPRGYHPEMEDYLEYLRCSIRAVKN